MIQLKRSNRTPSESTIQNCSQGFDDLLNRDDLGFFQLPHRDSVWDLSQQRYDSLQEDFDQFVFVGIGGSGLGGKTLAHAMQFECDVKKLNFVENIDQLTIQKTLSDIQDLSRVHWVFISKSGSTLETLSIANQVHSFLEPHGKQLSQCSTVISEIKPSPLTNWAKSHDIPVLPIDLDVGGRFSVLSPVGLLPAACLGIDLASLRKGALWALQQKDLVCSLAAHGLESFQREEFITQFWFYSDGLKVFGEWIQQLWAESLAKKQTLGGQPAPRVSTPMGCVGAIDQHSILQQVMEGARDKMIWLSRVQSVEAPQPPVANLFSDFPYLEGKNLCQVMSAEAAGMYSAYEEEDISVLELEWQDLGPESLGAGFMLFQLIVGTMGQALNINTFNQPGVELGKKLAKKILLPN